MRAPFNQWCPLLRLLISILLLPLSAQAGPWARGDGASFQSIKFLGNESTLSVAYYADFGITDRITVFTTSDTPYPIEGMPAATLGGKYTLFPNGARYPVSLGILAQLPASITTWDEVVADTRMAPTIEIGTGFETQIGHSWITGEATVGFLTSGVHSFTQVNIQAGIEPLRSTMLMLRGSYYSQDTYTKNALAVSGAVKITDTLHLFGEYEWVITNPHENQIAIGVWLTR